MTLSETAAAICAAIIAGAVGCKSDSVAAISVLNSTSIIASVAFLEGDPGLVIAILGQRARGTIWTSTFILSCC